MLATRRERREERGVHVCMCAAAFSHLRPVGLVLGIFAKRRQPFTGGLCICGGVNL